jgi:hypothetical protein
MWSHDVVGTSLGLASDLKLGQYLKVCLSLGQMWPEMFIVSRKDSSTCDVYNSNVGNDYW